MLFRRFHEIHIQTEELACGKEAATDGVMVMARRVRAPSVPTQAIASADNIDEHSSSVRGIPGPQAASTATQNQTGIWWSHV
jgi:hypothetical protein